MSLVLMALEAMWVECYGDSRPIKMINTTSVSRSTSRYDLDDDETNKE